MFSIRTTVARGLSIGDRKILAGLSLLKKNEMNLHGDNIMNARDYFAGTLGGAESLEVEDFLVELHGQESFRQQLWDATNIH